MTLTLPELIERLKELDEVTLLELLGITSESLIDRFSDVIEDKQDTLSFIVDWD